MSKRTFALIMIGLVWLYGGNVNAASVYTQTSLTPAPIPGPIVVDYNQLDANKDGALSMEEVGEKLFYTFDRDGNQLVDNREFTKPMVMTMAPMKQQTVQYIDFNGDGLSDQTTTTQQNFMQRTGLTRFDPSGGGLSASEFIELPIKRVDRDGSGQIDVLEWKQAYFAASRPLPQNDTFRYND